MLTLVALLLGGVAFKWKLNERQEVAFCMIAEKSVDPLTEPLRLVLSGARGTGKSRVINAVSDFFAMKGQHRRFHLASFTGVAAKNIGGMTLHAAMSFRKHARQSSTNNSA